MKDARKVSTAPLVAAGLVGGFLTARETGIRPLGGFGASHPLAKKIGAWPAVFSVAAVTATAAYVAVDSAQTH